MSWPGRRLIVGVGNLLLSDEGFGVLARRLLSSRTLPSGVHVLDGGTALLDVMAELGRYGRVAIVDAVRAGGPPGTIYRFDPVAELEPAPDESAPLSLHQSGALDALRLARTLGVLPPEVDFIGAEPERVEPGTELSPAVAVAAERVVSMLAAR